MSLKSCWSQSSLHEAPAQLLARRSTSSQRVPCTLQQQQHQPHRCTPQRASWQLQGRTLIQPQCRHGMTPIIQLHTAEGWAVQPSRQAVLCHQNLEEAAANKGTFEVAAAAAAARGVGMVAAAAQHAAALAAHIPSVVRTRAAEKRICAFRRLPAASYSGGGAAQVGR